jgi:hypothetical protein
MLQHSTDKKYSNEINSKTELKGEGSGGGGKTQPAQTTRMVGDPCYTAQMATMVGGALRPVEL